MLPGAVRKEEDDPVEISRGDSHGQHIREMTHALGVTFDTNAVTWICEPE